MKSPTRTRPLITARTLGKQMQSEPPRPGPRFAVVMEASSLGLGGDLVFGLTPKLQLRVGLNAFTLDYELEPDDSDGTNDNELKYEGDMDLLSGGLVLDWYPWGGHVRVSAGLFLNGNNIDATGTCQTRDGGGCEFGNFELPRDVEVQLNTDFDSLVPYLGVGWGNLLLDKGFGFSVGLGVYFQGSANAKISYDVDCGPFTDLCDAAVAREQERLDESTDDFALYPVLNLAVGYSF